MYAALEGLNGQNVLLQLLIDYAMSLFMIYSSVYCLLLIICPSYCIVVLLAVLLPSYVLQGVVDLSQYECVHFEKLTDSQRECAHCLTTCFLSAFNCPCMKSECETKDTYPANSFEGLLPVHRGVT